MAFRDIRGGDILRAQSKATGGKRPKCTKGKACSAACIDPNESCLVELSPTISKGIKRVSDKIFSPAEMEAGKKLRGGFEEKMKKEIVEAIKYGNESAYNKARKDIIFFNDNVPSQVKPIKVPIEWERVVKIRDNYRRAVDDILAKVEKARFLGQRSKFNKELEKLGQIHRVIGSKLGASDESKFSRWDSFPDSKFMTRLYKKDLGGAKIIYRVDDLLITDKIGKNKIEIKVSDYGMKIDFTLNGEYSSTGANIDIPKRERVLIALRVKRLMDQVVQSMDQGSIISGTPYTADGLGDKRRKSYEAWGLREDGDKGEMFGKVSRGKVKGATEDDYYDFLNRGKFNLPYPN